MTGLAALNPVILHSPLILAILYLFLFYQIKATHPALKVLAALLLFLITAFWPLVGTWTSPGLNMARMILGMFAIATVLRLLVFEGSFSRIFFGVASVGSAASLILIFIHTVLGDILEMRLQPGAATLPRFIFIAVALALFPMVYYRLRRPFIYILEAIQNEKWYTSGLTTLMLFIISYLGKMLSFLHSNLINLVAVVLPILTWVGFHLMLYQVIISRDRSAILDNRLKLSRQLLQIFFFYNEELAQKERALRLLRHDFRHLLRRLDTLALTGDASAVHRCIEGLVDQSQEYPIITYSDNLVLNAVVSYYFSRAAKNGTRSEARLAPPEHLPVSNEELAVLIGNALENCVKGTAPLGEAGRITFTLKPVKDRLVFIFENNYNEETDGYLRGEGLGLQSIRTLCARCGGAMQAGGNHGLFTLTAVLPLARPANEGPAENIM